MAQAQQMASQVRRRPDSSSAAVVPPKGPGFVAMAEVPWFTADHYEWFVVVHNRWSSYTIHVIPLSLWSIMYHIRQLASFRTASTPM